MRADRLLSILLLLQVSQRVTARELAERLEVSERTIHRDMEALCAAGIPITAERGCGGGWSLLHAYETKLTGLNSAEIQTLFFGKSSRLLADLGMGLAADAALIKLFASLPALARQNIEFTRQRLHVDGAGWYQSREDFPFLPLLQEAIWQERKVQIDYQRADGTTVERLADPLGLVAKGRIWYLIAAVAGEIRSYRVSRVQGVQKADAPCIRPEDFDLAAYWEQSVTDFKTNVPRYPVSLRAAPELLEQMRRSSHPRLEREGPLDEKGWAALDVVFEIQKEACDYILKCGPQIEVLEPISLRAKIGLLAQSTAALYAQS